MWDRKEKNGGESICVGMRARIRRTCIAGGGGWHVTSGTGFRFVSVSYTGPATEFSGYVVGMNLGCAGVTTIIISYHHRHCLDGGGRAVEKKWVWSYGSGVPCDGPYII